MILKKQDIYYNLRNFSVLIVYALFFTVQLFFNFDIVNNRSQDQCFSNITSVKIQPSVKADGQQNKKTNIRLNKRFQPANIPAYEPFTIEVPVCYVQRQNDIHYQNPSFSLFLLTTQKLRGPPVVA